MSKHYINEVGTDIILNAGSDITAATAVKVAYTKPDGTTGFWTGAVYNTNYIKYTLTSSGDPVVYNLNQAGVWRFQSYVESAAWTGYGEAVEIMVYAAGEAIISGELASLSNLKDYLGITPANTDDDVLLQKLISRKSDDIESACNRIFTAADYVEYYKGDGSDRLLVKNYPVNTIASIYDDTDRVWGADTKIDTAEISISSEVPGLVLLEDDIFSESESIENIKISYNAGYTAIPKDLESACIKECAGDYLESKGLVKGFEEGERDPYKLRQQAKDIINRYKRIR